MFHDVFQRVFFNLSDSSALRLGVVTWMPGASDLRPFTVSVRSDALSVRSVRSLLVVPGAPFVACCNPCCYVVAF